MYYNLLIRYHEHHNSYIDICRCYRSIYEVDVPTLDSHLCGQLLRPIMAGCCTLLSAFLSAVSYVQQRQICHSREASAFNRTQQGGGLRLARIYRCVLAASAGSWSTTGVANLAAAQIPSIQEDADKWAPVLKRICWYVVLAPADSDQVTLLNTTAADKKLGELPEYKELLQTLIVKEVGLPASLC